MSRYRNAGDGSAAGVTVIRTTSTWLPPSGAFEYVTSPLLDDANDIASAKQESTLIRFMWWPFATFKIVIDLFGQTPAAFRRAIRGQWPVSFDNCWLAFPDRCRTMESLMATRQPR